MASVELLEGSANSRGAAARGDAIDDVPPSTRGARIRLEVARVGFAVILLASWEVASGRFIDPFWVSRPSAILGRLWLWLSNGYLLNHGSITLQEMLWGFLAGASSGIAVGILLGRNAFLAKLLDPYITAANTLPKVALAPLFVLWFGIGMNMKIIMAAVIVFFLVFWNTYGGVRDVDRDLVDVARILGAKRRQLLTKIILPSALPWIYLGMKIAVPYSLIGAIVGEMIASNRGLGYVLSYSAGQFDTTGLFAGLLVLVFISVVVNEVLNRTQKHMLRWKASQQAAR